MSEILHQTNNITAKWGSRASRFLAWLKGKIVDLLWYKQARQEDDMLLVQSGVEVWEISEDQVEVHWRVDKLHTRRRARVAKWWEVGDLITNGTAEIEKAEVRFTLQWNEVRTGKRAKVYTLKSGNIESKGSTIQNMEIDSDWTADITDSKVGEIRWRARVVNIRAGSKVEKIIGADVVNIQDGAEVGEIVWTAAVNVERKWKTWRIIDARDVFHQWKVWDSISATNVFYTWSSKNARITVWWLGSIWGEADFVTTQAQNPHKPRKWAEVNIIDWWVDTISSFNPNDRINLGAPVVKVDVMMPTSASFRNVDTLREKYHRHYTNWNHRVYNSAQDGLRPVTMAPSVRDQIVNFSDSDKRIAA